jgi:hypothetical protein
MRKSLPRLLCLFFCISLCVHAPGQLSSERTKKLAVLKRDTAYKRFQSELAAIMKTAKGRKTNFAAASSLFANNKAILQGLKKRHNLSASVIKQGNSNQLVTANDHPAARLTKTVGMLGNIYNYELTGPFTSVALPRFEEMGWESTSSGNKITFTRREGDILDIGSAAFYFPVNIRVPNDPRVVGLRLEFEYEFFMAGWETEGGELSALLGFWAGNNFNSPGYEVLNNAPVVHGMEYLDYFKKGATFYNKTFTEIDDYTASRNSSFYIEGYVTPGTTCNFKLAAGYSTNSIAGDFGSYHYGEFELKKVAVKFLKAGE